MRSVKIEVQIALLTLGLLMVMTASWITTAIDRMNGRFNARLIKIAEGVEDELNELNELE